MQGYKTMAVSAALALLGVLQQANVIEVIPDKYRGIAIAAAGLIMAVLRYNTSTPVFTSVKEDK